jgi:predicted TIM-barrel fold metal-dependent hydrolase
VIVDTHVHYGPNKDGKNYSAAEILDEAAASGVDSILQVTSASAGLDNAESIEALSRFPDRIAGVIGRLEPLEPEIERRMAAFKAQPGILGIRLTTRTMGGKNGLGERIFDRYFEAAQKLDVAIQVYAPFQAPELLETAKRFPGIRFLIDHMAVRHEEEEDNTDMFRQWAALIALAEEPNVYIKVSYFPEAAMALEAYPYPTAQRYFRELYERVGAGKLIWGSNFPPVKVACTYRQALDFVRVHCDFISPGDMKAILGETFLAHFTPSKTSA